MTKPITSGRDTSGQDTSGHHAQQPLIKLTKKDFESDQDVRWCPGCGDYAILAAVQRAMPTFGLRRENVVFVSGIGCSSRFPYYMKTYGFHSIHGRAPSIATGLKVARPELSVWVVTGDGDGLSIGGNHLIHALRRNVDLNILLFNNQIYGLTKGQYSPTSQTGTKAPSTPMGSVDHPINPISVAMGANASFVARVVDTDAKHFSEILTRANQHKGSVFIELLQNCPVFNDGVWDGVSNRKTKDEKQLVLRHGSPLTFGKSSESSTYGKFGIRMKKDFTPEVVEVGEGPGKCSPSELVVHDEQAPAPYAFMLGLLSAPEFPIPVGVLRAVDRPSYDELTVAQAEQAVATRGKGDLKKLLYSGMTWEIGPDGVKH